MSFGIDLGTQSCRVAVWQNGLPVIIPDEEGNRALPSYVAFSKEGRRFGSVAKAQQGANVENTIYGVKYLLGSDFRDVRVQERVNRLPYKISRSGGMAVVKVSHLGKREKLALEEILAMQMSKLQRIVEAQTGVRNAYPVIAVPPGFSRHQRQAVVDACEIAGLPSPHLIDDTSAAALYYAFYSSTASPRTIDSQTAERNVLILNIGAGITSASLAVIEGGIVEIKAASSNLDLGGGNFDEVIASYIAGRLHSKDPGPTGFSITPRTRTMIVSMAERARKELSSAKTSLIDLEAVSRNGQPSTMTVTRDQVDVLCGDIYRGILSLLDDVVQQSGWQKSKIQEVLLVGGATRTSAILPALQSYFPDETTINSIRNLDEAVALGSAIYGALKGDVLEPAVSEVLGGMLLLDVVHAPLGVAILQDRGGSDSTPTLPADGSSLHECVFVPIIPRNAAFPCKKSLNFSIAGDVDRTAHVQVYEGESKQPPLNNFLGSFELHDIPAVRAGSSRSEVMVEFEIDLDRSVVVSVRDINRRKRSMTIRVGRLSTSDKEAMKAKAAALNEHDRMQENRIRRRNDFEAYCYSARESIESLDSTVQASLDWIHGSQVSSQSDVEFEQKQDAIVELVRKVLPPGFFISREAGDAAPL